MDEELGQGPLRAVTYSRNSDARQQSINGQQSSSRKFVETRGWVLVAELSDGLSASRYAKRRRDGWPELLELVPSIDVVVFPEASRGDRTLGSWVSFLDLCRDHGVLISATAHSTTYDPRKPRDYRSLAEDGVDAAYESDKTSLRLQRGMAEAAALGRPTSPVTFGYVRKYNPRTGDFVQQCPDPVRSAVVREIVTRIGEGEAISVVADDLTRREVDNPDGAGTHVAEIVRRTRRGEPVEEIAATMFKRGVLVPAGAGVAGAEALVVEVLARVNGEGGRPRERQHLIAEDLVERGMVCPRAAWQAASVSNIATNPAYVGVRVHRPKVGKRAEYEQAWEAIVTVEAHSAAVRALTGPERKRYTGPRPGRATSLVGNLAYCGTCGRRLKGKSGDTYGCCVKIGREVLDRLVVEAIGAQLSRPETFRQLRRAADSDDQVVVAARAEIDQLTKDLDMWRRSAARRQTTPESLASIEADITAQIEEAQRRADKASVPAPVRRLVTDDPNQVEVGGAGLTPAQQVIGRFTEAPLAAQREMIRGLMAITVYSSRSHGRTLAERVNIDWRHTRPGPAATGSPRVPRQRSSASRAAAGTPAA
jgi:DNA invertase Pin-like site-specific DNA recombinase